MKRATLVNAAVITLGIVLVIVGLGAAINKANATGDHEWRYDVSCTGVSGTRPNTDSVDSNIRIRNRNTDETQTFNYHGPDSAPAGPFNYTLSDYGVPSSWENIQILWVQVNGTNYHWEGVLECGGYWKAYEVEACWTMENTDGIENTYQFPQTRGCEPPKCDETVEHQYDTYWIRDLSDEQYFNSLTVLNSPADDARLDPHNYYSVVLVGERCNPEPPVTEPPAPEPPTATTPPIQPADPEPVKPEEPKNPSVGPPATHQGKPYQTSVCAGTALKVTSFDSRGQETGVKFFEGHRECADAPEIKEEGF